MTLTAQARVAFRSIYDFHIGGEPAAGHKEKMAENLTQDLFIDKLTGGLSVLMGLAEVGVDLSKLLDELFHNIQLDPSGESNEGLRAILNKHVVGAN